MEVSYLPYENVGISIAVFAIALAFIVLVWNAVKAIHEWRLLARKPTSERFDNHEERISTLEECCDEVRGKLQSDWEFQQDEVEMNRLLLKSIKQLLQHGLDGNNVDGLRVMEKEIDDYLIKHAK